MTDATRDDAGRDRGAPRLGRAERRFRSAADAANIALWSYCPDTGDSWFSDAWFTLLGYPPGFMPPGMDTVLSLMHPDDRAATTAAFEDLVARRTARYTADFRLRDASGSWRWLAATGAWLDRSEDGLCDLVCGMQADITERKRTEAALAEAARTAEANRARLERLARNSPVALYEFEIGPDGTISLPYVTGEVVKIFGVPRSEIEADGRAIFRRIHPEDLPAVQAAIEASRQSLSTFKVRFRVAHPDGATIWVQCHSTPQRRADGGTIWFGSTSDVSAEVLREAALASARDAALEMQDQMRTLALRDSLTGLPNRRHFDTQLDKRRHALARDPDQPPVALVRIDLDRFKCVNDTLGNAAGDAVLRHVGAILRDTLGAGDFAARVGGDEFSILLAPGRSVADARALAEGLRARLRMPFLFEGKVCRFGASFGIATSTHGSIASGDLMSFADAALYRAKAGGRDSVEVFDSALHESILDARRLATELEAAIENAEFEPFFHPQICARSGRLAGLEALARWRSPTGGIIAPERFMPVAEQIRAMPLIDRLILARGEDILAEWRAGGFVPPKLSFNISAQRLRDTQLRVAAQRLRQTGVEIGFELLETILLEETDEVVKHNIDLIREVGIHLEVDDFGSGHASILGLQQVRPDFLKIDRRLTATVTEAAPARELIGSIVSIARALDIRTTAEGVETDAQAAVLADLGCDLLQGYLYTAPLDAGATLDWALAWGATPRALGARGA